MKVLQVITSLNTGGAEKLILDSVPLYQKKGVATDVLSLNANETSFWQQLKGKSNGKLTGLTKKSVYNPLLVFKIMPYLKKYDVIHVHLFPALYWVVLAKVLSASKTPIVYTEHSTHNKRRTHFLLKKLDRYIYSKVDKIITIADEVDKNLKTHLKSRTVKKFQMINNGVDVASFSNATAKSKTDFFKEEDYLLIQVSSFRPQKDQPTLIRSLLSLPQNVKLILVGDGPLKIENETLVKQLNLQERVRFLGVRSDIPALLKTANVVVLSSIYEGMSLSSIEGMAAKPFIGSNVPGLREIVEGYGLLFEKGNAEELAQLISKLYHDQEFYNQIAKKCLERAQEFDISKMVEKYIKIYKLLTE